jgi:hypothetical protein
MNIIVLLGLAACSAARAQSSVDSDAVQRAERYMNARDRGVLTLAFLHFGQKYQGHGNDGKVYQVTRNGRVAEGEFCLRYKFRWGDNDSTTLDMFFSATGAFRGSSVRSTTAELNVPYLLSQTSIAIVGELILDQLEEKLSDADYKLIKRLIDNADAEGLYNWGLRFGSAANK